jgi:hypothetical protein
MTKLLTRATKRAATVYHRIVDGVVTYTYLDPRPGESDPEMRERVLRQTVERFDPGALADLETVLEGHLEDRERAEAESREPAELGGGIFRLDLTGDEIAIVAKAIGEIRRLNRMASYAKRVGTAPIGRDGAEE